MIKHKITIIGVSFFALVVAIAPLAAIAKNNGNGKGNGNGNGKGKPEKAEKRGPSPSREVFRALNGAGDSGDDNDNSNNNCITAFGHMIAPGWIKHHGPVDIGSECRLPFGIAKKLRFHNATSTIGTTTNDHVSPVISSVMTLSGTTSITAGWKTNENTTSKVFYSSNFPLNLSSASFVSDSRLGTSHVLSVGGLTSSTTYYMIVQATDAGHNVSTSATFAASTLSAATTTPHATAPVINTITSDPASTTAKIKWTTDLPSTSEVLYATSLPVDPLTALSLGTSTAVLSHALDLSGLATSTRYYFSVISGTGKATTTVAGNTFTTL
jgi:hypothetical protein